MGSRNTSSHPHAQGRRHRRVIRAIEVALRPHMESVESRVLFSAYQLSEFGQFGVNATGANPSSALVADGDGNLYGTTSAGGAWGAGTVFEMAAGSNAITGLASFNGTNGADPSGVTLDASGDLFGTTVGGGGGGHGTVFEIAKGSNAITTLVAFNGLNGAVPEGGLTQDSAGNLYGATVSGGTDGYGEVFEIPRGSSNLMQIASLRGSGNITSGVTIDGLGNIYWVANSKGAYGEGGVFEIAHGSGTVTTIASFNQSIGYQPKGGVTVDAAGNVYGTTGYGGSSGDGTVYEVASGSSAITTLATFVGTNGDLPVGDLALDGSGDLYGATWGGTGSSTYGTVFQVAVGSNAITTLASFGSGGRSPEAGVLLDSAGDIYGTTSSGGPGMTGTLYEVPKGASAPVYLAAFDGTNGSPPSSGVTLDSAGNLYGATPVGGASGDGTVFETAAGSNSITTLASFDGADGASPEGPLAFDSSGNLYGVTASGGSSYGGTVFEITHGSTTITTVAAFSYVSGDVPNSGLVADSSGNLYGVTSSGGPNGAGTVFEVSGSTHTLTTLAAFDSSTRFASGRRTTLTLDAAGDLYGSAYYGGPDGDGAVFELAKGSNQITTLASFNGTNGQSPVGGVVRDAAGNLYGTTSTGGANNGGVVFELPSGSNALTVLAAFDENWMGSGPGPLVMDAAGNLYGTTWLGGIAGGQVFELPKRLGKLISLMTFPNVIDGGVTLDAHGNLYGTDMGGGPGEAGTLFELTANTAVRLSPAGAPNPAGTNQATRFTVTVTGGVPDGEAVSLVDASNGNAVVATGTLSGGSATLTVPAGRLSPGTHNLVAAYAGDANYAASESASYAQTVQIVAPSVIGSPVVNGDNPNGLFSAAGQATPGQQRSMVEDVVYTFDEPVTIANANLAFTLALGPAGGTLPTTLYAQAVAGSNGTQWAVSLTGQPEGTIASIANGEYSITINPAYVFAAADGVTNMATGTGRTDTFYRLYGDVFGTGNVTALDYNRFKASMTTYNPMFDNYNTGNITALDYNLFKKDLSINYAGDGFVTTI